MFSVNKLLTSKLKVVEEGVSIITGAAAAASGLELLPPKIMASV
jgi:hypothetical protein